jgi:hypothetical protein
VRAVEADRGTLIGHGDVGEVGGLGAEDLAVGARGGREPGHREQKAEDERDGWKPHEHEHPKSIPREPGSGCGTVDADSINSPHLRKPSTARTCL